MKTINNNQHWTPKWSSYSWIPGQSSLGQLRTPGQFTHRLLPPAGHKSLPLAQVIPMARGQHPTSSTSWWSGQTHYSENTTHKIYQLVIRSSSFFWKYDIQNTPASHQVKPICLKIKSTKYTNHLSGKPVILKKKYLP